MSAKNTIAKISYETLYCLNEELDQDHNMQTKQQDGEQFNALRPVGD